MMPHGNGQKLFYPIASWVSEDYKLFEKYSMFPSVNLRRTNSMVVFFSTIISRRKGDT